MTRINFPALLKRFALLGLAMGTLLTTSAVLSACGGGGGGGAAGDLSRSSISYRQFTNGIKAIYLQSGSGLVLRGDPDLMTEGTQPWGYAYPAQMGLYATPGSEYHASFFGFTAPADEDAPLTGSVVINVGFNGYKYSNDGGLPAFLGFPSALSASIQLAGPLEITLNFDNMTWKTHIPDGSIVTWSNNGLNTRVFGEDGGSLSVGDTVVSQERTGSFDIMRL